MFSTLLAAAGAISAPELHTLPPTPNFRAEMNEGGVAAVEVQVLVSPEGKPVLCNTAFLNGPASNAKLLCAQILAEVLYTPAKSADGKPAFGVSHHWAHWRHGFWVGSDLPSWDPPDLIVPVARLPNGVPEMATLRVDLQINASGRVEGCRSREIGLTDTVSSFLCREASAEPVPPLTDVAGRNVSSVRPYLVRLHTDAFTDSVVREIRDLAKKRSRRDR